jgi:hypothetical protein
VTKDVAVEVDAEKRARRRRWRHWAIAAAAIVVGLSLFGFAVAQDERPYWRQPDVAVTVTEENPDAGRKSTGRGSCDASWFYVTSTDGRTGYFKDCADRHWPGHWITVRWHPDRTGLVNDATMLPRDIATLTLGMAPFIIGMYVAGDVWRDSATKRRLDDRIWRAGKRRAARRRRRSRRRQPDAVVGSPRARSGRRAL